MSLSDDIRKLMSPTDDDGGMNILYGDSYYRINLERRYGKDAVDKECNRFKGTCRDWSYESREDRRSDKKEVEALKSRVRRLEKDVKWLKKVVRQLVNSDNSTDGE